MRPFSGMYIPIVKLEKLECTSKCLRQNLMQPRLSQGKSKSGKRVKYVCTDDECDQKAWAKHDANLVCGHHMLPMNPSP